MNGGNAFVENEFNQLKFQKDLQDLINGFYQIFTCKVTRILSKYSSLSSKGDEEIRAKAKEFRKEEGKIKSKETRERKKDSIKNLPISERIKIRREARIKRRKRKMGGD